MVEKHPWKARLFVGLTMLVLAFLGMILTNIRSTGGWDYWKWIVPVYALLALWLSWFMKRQAQTVSPVKLWHELLHWTGTIGAVFLVTLFVDHGVVSRNSAGFFDLTILALSVFLAGIYVESFLIVIGICLGIFAAITSIMTEYLYAMSFPLLILGVIGICVTIWASHRRTRRLTEKPHDWHPPEVL